MYGEWLDKRTGALFTTEMIEKARVTVKPQYLPYVVVAVDVAVTSNEDSDETGIVTVGMDNVGDFYVLRDDSIRGTPSEWSACVNKAYNEEKADCAVYENNQGGEMVEYTIKSVNPMIPCKSVRATRGKVLRAEPIVALYEQGRVHHVGYYPELESEMVEWTPEDNYSPDRLDALVWAVTYLMANRTVRSGYQPNSPIVSNRANYRPGLQRPPTFRNYR